MAYSVDLREKVIGTVDDGMAVSEAAALFYICEKTIYLWLKLRDISGNLKPKTGYQKGHSHKITDWDLFKKFAEENSEYTSPQLIIRWEKLTQVKVSESVMKRSMRKVGYTFKKKPFLMWKQTKKSEKNF